MMKKRLLSLSLIAILAMSGCSNKIDEPVVAYVGEEPITISQFNFYLEGVKQQMVGTELSSEEDWYTVEIEGKKAIEIAKEQALEMAAKNIACVEIYKKLGYKFTKEDEQSIKTTKEEVVSQYGGEEGYQQFLTEMGIDDGFVDFSCKSMFCSQKLYEDYSANQVITDEQVKAFYDENYELYFAPYRRAKNILFLTQDESSGTPYPDEYKQDIKKTADEVYQMALNGDDFDALVQKYSQDPGSLDQPEGYTFTDGEMVQEFQDCVDALPIGGIGFCETPYGYHIVQRLEVDMSYFSDGIKSMISSQEFNTYIDQKMTEYGLTVTETEEINKALEPKTEETAENTEVAE